MSSEDSPPSSYQPLPQICSETINKYRWPLYHQIPERGQPQLIEVKTSLDGPLQSSLTAPTLRYHRQSLFSDDYVKRKPITSLIPPLESSWIDPIGKRGDFDGESTYEEDYTWQDMTSRMTRIPLFSTIELGILPLLGTKSDSDETHIVNKKYTPKVKNLQKVENMKKHNILLNKKYISKDFVPLQDLWSAETTYRDHYLIPPKGWKTKRVRPPSPVLKFSGNIPTITTAMLDYQDPKYVDDNEDFKKSDYQKDDTQSEEPFRSKM